MKTSQHVLALSCPPIPLVRIGLVGLGQRGMKTLERYAFIEGAEIRCLADISADRLEMAAQQLEQSGRPAAELLHGSDAWREVCRKDIDLVYICTPNQMHFEHICLCLSHHKHVICEKPMVSDEEQVKQLFAMARKNHCFLMEAEKTMFTPLNVKLKSMIVDGVIGNLRSIKASYCSITSGTLPDSHWVFDPAFGGASYDIGVYPVSFAHFFADANARVIQAQPVYHPPYECDFGMNADVLYENGIYGFLQCNWLYSLPQKGSAILAGDLGYIEIPAFWKGNKAYLHKDGEVTEISVDMKSDFTGEITHAVECIENVLLESPVLGEEMSRRIIRLVEYVQHQMRDR